MLSNNEIKSLENDIKRVLKPIKSLSYQQLTDMIDDYLGEMAYGDEHKHGLIAKRHMMERLLGQKDFALWMEAVKMTNVIKCNA